MIDSEFNLSNRQQRGNWILLRTLVLVRWAAITGQITAVVVAWKIYHIDLNVGACAAVIGLSVIWNLITYFVFPENKRLDERENLLMVLFDLVQLVALLYLTGGLHNPFSILIVAPVVVSAAALGLRSTLFIAVLAIVFVTVLTNFYVPLRTVSGQVLRVPDLFLFGTWAAIVTSVIFLAGYSRKITGEMHSMSDALQATQMALAREQKLTDLGGVIAAAAHELGTPLATIKLASSELMDELSDRPDLCEDAALIHDQANRCRDILRSMGQTGKDDLMLRTAPFSEVLRDAAEPHLNRNKTLHFEITRASGDPSEQPQVYRAPEMIHGLRNLIQNAVDFAETAVWIELDWTEVTVTLRIIDNGPGFAPEVIGRIGEPFLRRRSRARRPLPDQVERREYEGMGLGLFIAKTLLERTGAELSFANGSNSMAGPPAPDRGGAIVEVVWPRARIEGSKLENESGLGENQKFQY